MKMCIFNLLFYHGEISLDISTWSRIVKWHISLPLPQTKFFGKNCFTKKLHYKFMKLYNEKKFTDSPRQMANPRHWKRRERRVWQQSASVSLYFERVWAAICPMSMADWPFLYDCPCLKRYLGLKIDFSA